MKQGKVIVRENLVVGYWEFIPMKSGDEFSAPQDMSTFRVAEQTQATNKQSNHWWTETNWPILNEAFVNIRYASLIGQFDAACVESGGRG